MTADVTENPSAPATFIPRTGSAEEDDSKLAAFEWLATAHPHAAYATWPERFWLFFQTKRPGKTRAEMEKMLIDSTHKATNEEVLSAIKDADEVVEKIRN